MRKYIKQKTEITFVTFTRVQKYHEIGWATSYNKSMYVILKGRRYYRESNTGSLGFYDGLNRYFPNIFWCL